MAAKSRCAPGCPQCSLARHRRASLLSWLLIVTSWILIGLSWPVGGLPGVGLSVAGVVAAYAAYRVSRKGAGR
jgi:hypothetical protein